MRALANELTKALCKECHLEFAREALFCPNCGTAKNREVDGDPLLGTTIGDRYQLIDQIGQGASGAIYLAEHVTLRRKVVVKVLHHELSRDDLAIERFRREATTVGDLDNDHIVEIYDFGRTTDGRLYLAMEHLEGQTLAARLAEKGQLDKDEAVDILIQIGEALIEAHAMGYVHRDLRPRNMFLAVRRKRANFLKLLDFGLAKLVEQEGEAASTSLGMTFGDPHYMSPEQARGEPVDRRADIYSLCCIAYELLTGKPPFHGGKVFDVLTRHVEDTPLSLSLAAPDTPAWLERAIMRCLAKKPEERYITVYRFVEALRQGVDSGVIMSDEVALSRPATQPASVARAMEKLAAREEEEARSSGPSSGEVLSSPKKSDTKKGDTKKKNTVGSQTVLGVGALAKEEIEAARAKASAKVPAPATAAIPTPVVTSDAKVVASSAVPKKMESADKAGPTQRLGKQKEPNAESSAGLSALWYADGETLDGGDGLNERELAKLDKARGRTEHSTGLMSTVEDDLYEEDFYETGSRKKFFIVGAGIVVIGILLAVLWPSGDTKKSENETAAAVAVQDNPVVVADASVVPNTQSPDAALTLGSVDAAVAVVTPKVTPRDVKPRDVKPRDVKTHDGKPHVKRHNDKPQVKRHNDTPHDLKPRDTTPAEKPIDPFANAGPSEQDKVQASVFAKQGSRDLQMGDSMGAASNFNKARALNPRNAQAISGLGQIALEQGAFAAAVGHLKRASKMRAGSARIWTLLGEAYMGTGNSSQAASAFIRALKINPDSSRARNGYNEATGN